LALTPRLRHKNIAGWLDRMKALPGWAHPYDLMPGHPLPQSAA
jgi:glutathione S-transferase